MATTVTRNEVGNSGIIQLDGNTNWNSVWNPSPSTGSSKDDGTLGNVNTWKDGSNNYHSSHYYVVFDLTALKTHFLVDSAFLLLDYAGGGVSSPDGLTLAVGPADHLADSGVLVLADYEPAVSPEYATRQAIAASDRTFTFNSNGIDKVQDQLGNYLKLAVTTSAIQDNSPPSATTNHFPVNFANTYLSITYTDPSMPQIL